MHRCAGTHRSRTERCSSASTWHAWRSGSDVGARHAARRTDQYNRVVRAELPRQPGRARVTPSVSIGLPVYNGARFLRRSLDALLGQSFRDFELVISDNASTDATPQIISEYAARDSRVLHMRAAVNGGVSANFRRVLTESSGRYFMWAGCDDWWAPTFVERVFGALERDHGAVVAMCDVEREDESGATLDTVRFSGMMDPSRMTPARLAFLLAGGRPFHLFVYGLFRADVLRRAFNGFAPVVAADRLLMCRMALTGGFTSVGEVLHKRVVRRTSIAGAVRRRGHRATVAQQLGALAAHRLCRSVSVGVARRPVSSQAPDSSDSAALRQSQPGSQPRASGSDSPARRRPSSRILKLRDRLLGPRSSACRAARASHGRYELVPVCRSWIPRCRRFGRFGPRFPATSRLPQCSPSP